MTSVPSPSPNNASSNNSSSNNNKNHNSTSCLRRMLFPIVLGLTILAVRMVSFENDTLLHKELKNSKSWNKTSNNRITSNNNRSNRSDTLNVSNIMKTWNQSIATTSTITSTSSSLKFCQSGNEYLSLEQGGRWIDTGILLQGYNNDSISERFNWHQLCYQRNHGYNDTIRWSPPCRPYPWITINSTTNDDNEEQEEGQQPNNNNKRKKNKQKMKKKLYPNQKAVNILLWGDSLTSQIYTAQTLQENPTPKLIYTMMNHKPPYLIPSIAPFPSSISECYQDIHSNPKDYYFQNFSSTKEFMDATLYRYKKLLNGKSYDYIFFNAFAHYSHLVNRLWNKCYSSYESNNNNNDSTLLTTNATTATTTTTNNSKSARILLMEDVLQHYQNEMIRISQLLQRHSPNTLVYYRTSQPHAMKWTPARKPLDQLPNRLTRDDCFDDFRNGDNMYLWKCAYVMNDIAVEAFQQAGHRVLDTEPAMSLRADAHPCSNNLVTPDDPYYEISQSDCNHFCLPGPPNVILQAMEAEIFAREWGKRQQQGKGR